MNKNKRKKILFIIPSLAGGGAERIFLNILKYINREKFMPSLVLFEKKEVYVEQIPEDVDVYDLKKRNRFDFFKLIFRLACRIYRNVKPDIVVSFLDYANFINIFSRIISFFIKPVIIISQRNYTSASIKLNRLKKIKSILVKNFYPRADKIIAISKGVKKDLINNFNIPLGKVKVIYNPVDLLEIDRLVKEPIENGLFHDNIPIIVACGRLTKQKNYPLLLHSFSRVLKRCNARLLILGEGEEKDNFIKLCLGLKISDRVFFPGFQKNPFKYIGKADIFVLSSLFEGFSNVIIEAMACGIPVISTNCPSGPDEIITDGVNGLLVPVGNVEAMKNAIMRLLKDKTLRKNLSEAGRKRAEDFRVKKIVKEYENLFSNVLAL
jgi:glycosyltransferase involved in cell wall biosynthesis